MQLNRRALLRALVLAFGGVEILASAVRAGEVRSVGLLMLTIRQDDPLIQAMRSRMSDLGYVEGRNVRYEFRTASGKIDQLPLLARELVRSGVDVVVAAPDPSALAAAREITVTPVVAMMFTTDPVKAGVVESLSHPGRNVTGLYGQQSEIVAKRLQLLKEVVPGLNRVGALYDAASAAALSDVEVGGRALGMLVAPIELKGTDNFEHAFSDARAAKVGAMILLDSVPVYIKRAEIAQLSLRSKLPTIAQFHQFTEAGGLMSYGTEPQAVFARAAYFVDRILRGAKPADLPVEQITNFRLAVNLRTAKTMGITVPAAILARADGLIE